MRWLFSQFLKGCLVLFPIVGTVYAVWFLLSTVDLIVRRLVDLAPWWGSIAPGLGLLIAVSAITTVGFVASNVVGRTLVSLLEQMVHRVPLVGLLYGAIRDLTNAFVGERRSFDRPAIVRIGNARVFGFVTRERFDEPQLTDCMAVYVPQSYNFAGNLIVVSRDQVELLDVPGSEFLAFIVSGAVHQGSSLTQRPSADPRDG